MVLDQPPIAAPDANRRPLDNPRVLILVALLLIAVLAGLFWLSNRTSEIPVLELSDVLTYALVGVDLALVVALFFFLGRTILKLWVEQRQA